MQTPSLLTVPPRPFLKWAGGKGRLIQQYRPYFPQQFEHYYEPFLGGGAVFFYLLPSRSILTDINPALVNVYCCVKESVEAVIDKLLEHEIRHCADYYYHVRAHPGTDPIERAARLLYLNKTCYNGLYRENSKGQFNVPLGRYKNPRVCDPNLLRATSAALQTAQIEAAPFDAVLTHATSKQDFVYFDPPYYPISATSSFTAYNRHVFGEEQQIRLRDTVVELAQRGVKVMLSNSDCPFVRDLYRDFQIQTITAARAINSKAERRGKITEVLVTNY